MLSSSEIENLSTTIIAPVSRAVAHLDLLRTGVISRLDAIASTSDATMRDAILADTRVFVETYARAPPPAPRAPPMADERCVALRTGGGQCTRRRKGDTTFCGTHARCTANVGAEATSSTTDTVEKVVHTGTERALRAAVSSSGIPQFVDESGAIWCAEDVCAAHVNPRSV
jgi:hypothetical protein